MAQNYLIEFTLCQMSSVETGLIAELLLNLKGHVTGTIKLALKHAYLCAQLAVQSGKYHIYA